MAESCSLAMIGSPGVQRLQVFIIEAPRLAVPWTQGPMQDSRCEACMLGPTANRPGCHEAHRVSEPLLRVEALTMANQKPNILVIFGDDTGIPLRQREAMKRLKGVESCAIAGDAGH